MKPVICFIDDSGFEHDLVKYEIAPSAPDLEFVQTYTFAEARDLLAAKTPSLFLLDLWGQDEDVVDPYLTPMDELKKKTADFPKLDQIYEGLDSFQGDINNEFLKRLFAIVDCWRKLFEDVCGRIGQNSRYGLFNLGQTRLHYPQIPAVFYTRKSLINDVAAMFKAGADGLFIKPTGYNDDETRRLTREYAPRLLNDLRKIMSLDVYPSHVL
jgi:DNA-binding NarL/FixJ family response regulator